MARVWSCGFELQSTTAGVEFDGISGSGFSISTTTKRSGEAALRCYHSTAATSYAYHQVKGNSGGVLYARFYLRIATAPAAKTGIIEYCEYNSQITIAGLYLTTDRKLQLYYIDNTGSRIQVGSDSSQLALDTWYRIELKVDDSLFPNSLAIEAKLDGTTFGSGTVTDIAPSNYGGRFYWGIDAGGWGGTEATTADLYFDDIAVNDTSGSYQKSWPGEGSIVHLTPNAAGDNNQWLKQDGGAGDSNNYQSVNETTPNDATTYLKRTSGQPIDDYNVDNWSYGNATITLVSVGVRFGATSNTAGSGRNGILRIKGQSGGTVLESSSIDWSYNGWRTHSDPAPRTYKLTAYVNPQDGEAWELSDINTMQIGMKPAASSTNELRVSTLWALVEYVPITNLSPTVELNYPNNGAEISDTTPTLEFTGTDPDGDDITYQLQIDKTSSSFEDIIVDVKSDTDAGFENLDNPEDTDPFNSGDKIGYTVGD